MDVLASYMQWYTENPDSFVNKFNLKNDDDLLPNSLNRVDRILPQICTASALANMKHALTQLQYRFAEKYDLIRKVTCPFITAPF